MKEKNVILQNKITKITTEYILIIKKKKNWAGAHCPT